MASVNFVVMGKTGAGKSTLVNAVLKKELAPTGSGSGVTREIQKYSQMMDFYLPDATEHTSLSAYQMVHKCVNLYDTVGLEIDQKITQKTLKDIRKILDAAKFSGNERDITLVWFCLSSSSSRFESYESDLIQDLSVEYEIPFVIVITQCFSDEKGELEKQIKSELPELATIRILAKDYKLRGGTIPAFGVDDLLSKSILGFNERKIRILESKLDKLQREKRDRSESLSRRGKSIIGDYSSKAEKAAFLPVLGIPFVHGLCGKMVKDLNELYGIRNSKDYPTDVITNTILGAVATPLMAIPLLSIAAASAYIEVVGETYLEALSSTVPGQASNEDVMRILQELSKRKKERED